MVAARWPAARGELRGLMARLDGGEGVRLDGVADKDLSRLLHDLFHNLALRNRHGVYSLPKGAVPLLSTMAPVLAEAPDASLADTDIDVLLGAAEPPAAGACVCVCVLNTPFRFSAEYSNRVPRENCQAERCERCERRWRRPRR